MATETNSMNIQASIPHMMLRGKNETLPRAFGRESELAKLGLERRYTESQEAGILRACADYYRLRAAGKHEQWSKHVLQRDDRQAAEDAASLAVEAERRLQLLKALQELVAEYEAGAREV